MSLINERYASQHAAGNLTVLPLGKKSWDYFRKRSIKMEDSFYEIFHNLEFQSVSKIANFVMKHFEEGTYDKVEIIYNEFKNVATQVVRTEQFLPIVPPEGESTDVDYIYEPSLEFIINELIPNSLRVQLFKALLESNASEHGARMTAMDQATDNAGELLDQLKLTYNQTRQAAITKEILEIVGGAEALNN
jgi:F-type H+-transporting ATPase subunit gamma